jgi:hypothetical protein
MSLNKISCEAESLPESTGERFRQARRSPRAWSYFQEHLGVEEKAAGLRQAVVGVSPEPVPPGADSVTTEVLLLAS